MTLEFPPAAPSPSPDSEDRPAAADGAHPAQVGQPNGEKGDGADAAETTVADGPDGSDGEQEQRPGGDAGVTGALRTIVIPDHDETFWDDLGSQLADEPQLRLRPRAAVRPITQPPPIVDDRLPFDDGDLRPRSRTRTGRRRRTVLAVILSIIVIAVALALEGQDDPNEDVQAGGATTTQGTGETQGSGGSTTSTGAAAPIDVAAPLTPGGVGPLTIGTPLRELQTQGAPAIVVDQPTFQGTGGTCFDATVTGVPDLVLRFRSPQPGAGISDPADGVLAAVAVDSQLGSMRTTEAGIALGATEDQVRAAYPGNLAQADNDYVPGGHVLTHVPAGTGNGIAFMTDGTAVTGIVVGASDLIGYPEGCPA
jgi:hypothetical protein